MTNIFHFMIKTTFSNKLHLINVYQIEGMWLEFIFYLIWQMHPFFYLQSYVIETFIWDPIRMFCMHIECIYAWISCPLRIHACCINSYYLELKRVQSNVLYVLPLFSFCENVLLKERKSVLYLYVNSSFFLRQNWFDIYSGQKFNTTITCVVTCRYVIS